jgi:hypothetical protein
MASIYRFLAREFKTAIFCQFLSVYNNIIFYTLTLNVVYRFVYYLHIVTSGIQRKKAG